MEIVFVTREPDVCTLIADALDDATLHCVVLNDFLSFTIQLIQGTVRADLLVCDFCEFQHMLHDVYDSLKKLSHPIPIVFYNDPYPDRENRVCYWLSQNERLYDGSEFHQLIPLFVQLNTAIEDPQIRPHISLLSPPVPLKKAATDLMQFRMRTKIPPSLFSLFSLFYDNLSRDVSIREIRRHISSPSFKTSVQKASVYSYISRLKKYITSDAQIGFKIIRSSSGYYQMIRC